MTPSTLHPRYLAKRWPLLMLFALLSATGGFVQDPRFFRSLTTVAAHWSISTSMLTVGLLGMFAAMFALIRTFLETRYALASQAWMASALFAAVFIGTSVLGFAARLLVLSDTPDKAPQAIRWPNEALVAAISLTLSAAGAAAIYNLLFIQKTDYAKFRAELRRVVSLMEDMELKKKTGYVPAVYGPPLAAACVDALKTLEDLIKIETADYAKFAEARLAVPLRALTAAISIKQVQENPESLLHDADLAPSLQLLRRSV
jgi:hypothetical protein